MAWDNLATAVLNFAEKLIDYKLAKLPQEKKEELYELKTKLKKELEKPDHLKIDGTIDRLSDDIVLFIESFSKEIKP